ncbi:MAG: CPBP family intramembrane metalloprotease [Anaerolineales bacterium]|nr:CPBP family intramembrane metalloprotease [Anaerolineales bacterium]
MGKVHEGSKTPSLPFAWITPGLIYIVFLDVVTIAGLGDLFRPLILPWNLIIALLPWVTVLVLRCRNSVLGFNRRLALYSLGWGVLMGAVWRGLSLGFNALVQGGWTRLGWGIITWLGAIILIPIVEETFFRGYLCRALVEKIGSWPGILLQALLFSFHPGHWVQGWPHLMSIFAFGILAGWLIDRFGSIWAPIGAHAFANVLPEIMRSLI